MAEGTSRADGIGITIKTGKGYDDTWLTFTGSPVQVRTLIKETFDLDDTDLTLFEVVANATKVAHGVTTAVSMLKGTVVPPASSPKGSVPDEAQQDVWAAADESPVNPYDALLVAIDKCADVNSLKRLYADNKEKFTADTDHAKTAKAAWQAKGKALQQKV